MEAQEVLRQGCRRRIGSGTSTKIWKVPWLTDLFDGCLTTDMPSELKDATVQGLFAENQYSWDEEVLEDLFNERDRNLIRQVPLSGRRREDVWFWRFEDKGEFTVRSCYRSLQGENPCPDRKFWKQLWNLRLPGKVINLLWRVCRRCLPTAKALVAKGVNITPICSWCQRDEEDDVHVLFHCCFAQEVWNNAGLKQLVMADPNDTVMSILQKVFRAGTEEQIMMVSLICWNLWSRRNSWVWSNVNMSTFGVKAKAYNMLTDWNKASEERRRGKEKHTTGDRIWTRPPTGWIKINTDASCSPDSDQIGVGCVVRNDRGEFVRARSRLVQGKMQPREAEAIGLKEALTWTKDWRCSKCIFECDAKMVVDAINGSRGRTYFHMIIDDCLDILKHFEEVLVVFVYRSANTVAHLLAKAAYSMSGLTEWLTAPESIMCNLEFDDC